MDVGSTLSLILLLSSMARNRSVSGSSSSLQPFVSWHTLRGWERGYGMHMQCLYNYTFKGYS